MTPTTAEWVAKAEGDWASANRELRARKDPNFDAAGFHAQQCAEKYLKARIQESGKPVRFIHDLVKILETLEPVPLELAALRVRLDALNRFAVESRYPGSGIATKARAKELVSTAKIVREFVRRELKLPTDKPKPTRKRQSRKRSGR